MPSRWLHCKFWGCKRFSKRSCITCEPQVCSSSSYPNEEDSHPTDLAVLRKSGHSCTHCRAGTTTHPWSKCPLSLAGELWNEETTVPGEMLLTDWPNQQIPAIRLLPSGNLMNSNRATWRNRGSCSGKVEDTLELTRMLISNNMQLF